MAGEEKAIAGSAAGLATAATAAAAVVTAAFTGATTAVAAFTGAETTAAAMGTFTAEAGAALKPWNDTVAMAPTAAAAITALAGRVFRKFCICCRSSLISV
jgi:hypothetical protein